MSPGYQRLGSKTRASQTNQRPRTETLAVYGTTSGSVRARRNPLPNGTHAGPQQAQAPGPESPSGMRSDITDRMPPPPAAQSRGVHHVQRLPEHTASIGPVKVLAQQ